MFIKNSSLATGWLFRALAYLKGGIAQWIRQALKPTCLNGNPSFAICHIVTWEHYSNAQPPQVPVGKKQGGGGDKRTYHTEFWGRVNVVIHAKPSK